jgi:Protein of unknown function (DUF3592)
MTHENFFALLCVISGLGIIVMICRIFYFYKVTIKKWRTVEGEVISYGKIPPNSDTDTGWTDKMIYSYTVDGVIYESKEFTKNIRISFSSESEVELKNYRQGDMVTVYYNPNYPNYPNKSVIDNKFSYYNLAYIIISIIAFAIAYSTFEPIQF